MNALLQAILGACRRHPFVIAASALAILLWVANYFIWRRHQETSAGYQTLQRSGEDMLQSLTNHGRITAELATVKEALAYIENNLVREGDLPENNGYFYQLETASRIRLQALNQLSSMPPPADQPFKTVPFTLRTTGTYRQILRFLRELETGPRLFKIQTFALAQGGTANEPAAAPVGRAGGTSPGAAPAAGTSLVTLDLTLEMLAQP
ncbi:MAG: type 4a pilus biogenesis protein PilO [Lacunisphaera sp.]|nr:type 4a pilus biogenesis protein PilO [Lacunisphaera sp.]